MAISFDGKVAIVTGAGGGLGRSHALEFARRGAKVVVNDLGGSVDGSGGSSDAAQKVVAEIVDAGGEAISNGGSVTDDAGVESLIAAAIEAYGRIDILVNNAGILRDRTILNMSVDDFEAVLNVHLLGTVKPTKAVWPIMREQNYGRVCCDHLFLRALWQFRAVQLRRSKTRRRRHDEHAQARGPKIQHPLQCGRACRLHAYDGRPVSSRSGNADDA